MANLLLRHYRHIVWAGILVWLGLAGGVLVGWWQAQGRWGFYFFATLLSWALLAHLVRAARERFVREAALPQFLKRKLRDTYPHLAQKEAELVEQGLRQFFVACQRSKRQFVAMPSRAVDVLWHEFILHTRAYQDWCQRALGSFLHHTPAEALGRRAKHNDGLRRAWYWACQQENIDPRAPSRLPLLFALDAKLNIANGFFYLPDCSDIARKNEAGGNGSSTYCGTDFADASYDGSSDDFGGAESNSDSGGDGDGGSDGGGGCGGD
jgi:hypothetical protein